MVLIALSKVAKASSLTFKVLTSLPAAAVNSLPATAEPAFKLICVAVVPSASKSEAETK